MLQDRPACSGSCILEETVCVCSAVWCLTLDTQISSCLPSQVASPDPLVAKWHVPGMVACPEHTEGTWIHLQAWSFMGEAATSFLSRIWLRPIFSFSWEKKRPERKLLGL